MRDNYSHALDLVLDHEGGYVDHPRDPGGATNRGITHRTYLAYLDRKGLMRRHVKYATMPETKEIYKDQYWDTVKGDKLPSGIDYAVFDAAVNSGPSRAIKWLQRSLGVAADGALGPKTMDAVMSLDQEEEVAVIQKMLALRLGFMKRLNHWPTFGRGWQKRVDNVRTKALEMARLSDDDIAAKPVATVSVWELILDLLTRIFGGKNA